MELTVKRYMRYTPLTTKVWGRISIHGKMEDLVMLHL